MSWDKDLIRSDAALVKQTQNHIRFLVSCMLISYTLPFLGSVVVVLVIKPLQELGSLLMLTLRGRVFVYEIWLVEYIAPEIWPCPIRASIVALFVIGRVAIRGCMVSISISVWCCMSFKTGKARFWNHIARHDRM